jgi:hypothetical protein
MATQIRHGDFAMMGHQEGRPCGTFMQSVLGVIQYKCRFLGVGS